LAIRESVRTLHRMRISHGDLKATNLLWHARQGLAHRSRCRRAASLGSAHARKAWRRDRARLLRNWPEASALGAGSTSQLPPA
jgi:hypothetical protein